MNVFVDKNNPGINKDNSIDGYYVKRIVELKEIESFFYELEHSVTGARHIHISNGDKENTFGVAFKTVPTDSTGVAHILEHTVLCGSKNFPVRDPFFSMIKRSLNTFMNAFTASDWTMYPFSTQNKKDFYNLMKVYLDAAFFPNLNELNFKQEGHRLEIEDEPGSSDSAKLVYKGIVYNEMKGAMSAPSDVFARTLQRTLYPSTTYRHNSGGDPAEITKLTRDQLKAFHGRHYHPSNAFFYTYGNLPLSDHLLFIQNTIMKHFERIDPKTDVPSQPRWDRPKSAKFNYPLAKNEDPAKKCQVCVAWLTADILDSFEILALSLLESILLGNSGSPLRKALIDSGLGTALSDGTGFDPENRDSMFACGLKDVEESSEDKIEEIIFNVLETLAEEGIEKSLIESAIHQIEFHRKEITNTPYPYGIKLLSSFCGSWFHGGDPVRILKFDTDLSRLRDELTRHSFFENRIKTYFLENPHRVLFKLAPDQMMQEREDQLVVEELDDMRKALAKSDLDVIRSDTEALSRLQTTKEDVSCLPTLGLEDVPPSVKSVKETTTYNEDCRIPVTCYEQPTAGIFYFTAAIGAGALQKQLVPLVPFFCRALPKIGTVLRGYAEMARDIDAYTGGIGLAPHARTGFNENKDCIPFLTFSGKCLVRNQDRMLEIIEELMCKYAFSDLTRLRNLLLEYRAGLESMVIHNGHSLAISLASRNFSPANALSEIWHGVHQVRTIKELTDNLTDEGLESISKSLTTIGRTLFSPDNIRIALIGENPAPTPESSPVASIEKELGDGPKGGNGIDGFRLPESDSGNSIPREGWSTSSAVSFVASAFKTIRMGHEDAPVMSVISKMLRSMYVHREIREKGGAYGGYSLYSLENGVFCFASYRDPHVITTLKVFDGASSFIRSGDYSDEDVHEAILQVCSEIDRPDPPGPSASKAFYRKIISLSDQTRKCFKEQLLSLNRDRVMTVADRYFSGDEMKRAVAVISSEEKLKAANTKISDDPLKLFKI